MTQYAIKIKMSYVNSRDRAFIEQLVNYNIYKHYLLIYFLWILDYLQFGACDKCSYFFSFLYAVNHRLNLA